jgi:dCTP deaminase
MILGGEGIKHAFTEGPWKAFRGTSLLAIQELKINPNSVDVTLGNVFLIPKKRKVVDSRRGLEWDRWVADQHIQLDPGDFLLGVTRERFDCTTPYAGKRWTQMLHGRSTIGRLGVGIHITAAYGDYGFKGFWTLELTNSAPYAVKLYVGDRIGQVEFQAVQSPMTYQGNYPQTDIMEPVAPCRGNM